MDAILVEAKKNQAVAPKSVMAELKNQSHAHHKALEKLPCLQRLFSPDYQLAEYGRLLASFYGFYHTLEPLLFNGLPNEWEGWLGHRQKLALLRQDLAALGIAADALPVCRQLPVLDTLAKKMGAVYVLEGSTLGGRIISKRLLAHFGEQLMPSLNFYTCYGASVDMEWKNFNAFMESRFSNREQDMDTAAQAACATFLSLQQWLEQSSG